MVMCRDPSGLVSLFSGLLSLSYGATLVMVKSISRARHLSGPVVDVVAVVASVKDSIYIYKLTEGPKFMGVHRGTTYPKETKPPPSRLRASGWWWRVVIINKC